MDPSSTVRSPPRGRAWLDRIVGVAVGSVATAWILRPEPASDAPAVALDASGPSSGSDGEAIGATGQGGVADPGGDLAAIAADPPRVDHTPRETEAVSLGGPVPDRVVPAAEPPAPPSPEPVAAVDTPVLPLPRMPGDTRLSASARRDHDKGAWILKAAYRVHARDHHVIAFYRKALADQGLVVTRTEDPPDASGATKTYLHGRSARVHAQVGILPRTDALETRVWILWRTRA